MLNHPDIFSVVEMTTAINKLPAMPLRLSSLFEVKSVSTIDVALDVVKGRIVLVENQDRSAPAQSMAGKGEKRQAKVIRTSHLPLSDTVAPEDIQGKRAFGSTEPMSAATAVNNKLQTIKNNITMTVEYHRLGALKGVVLDADGKTVLHDLYDFFGVTKSTQPIAFPVNASEKNNPILSGITEAKRKLEAALGGVPYQRVECMVGKDFWDAFTGHKLVREYWERWLANQAAFGDNDWRKKGFLYGNVLFYEASEVVGGRTLVEDSKGHMYPVGPGICSQFHAPANWMETVNTMGMEFYARMDELDHGRGIYIEGQTNPLTLCNFPEALIELGIE